jgi:3-deoxy-D-manno-octulosonic-acid transferase
MVKATIAWRYRFISVILFPFWLLHASWLSLRYRTLDYLVQRLGFCQHNPSDHIWVHASSVGEVALVKPLIEALSESQNVHLTTFTITGYLYAKQQLPQLRITVLPIDFWPITRYFFHCTNRLTGLIAETELWPETLYQAHKAGMKLLQINARLSSKTIDSPAFILPILKTTLSYFDQHLTRTESDNDNFLRMGVAEEKLCVAGNLKYAAANYRDDQAKLLNRPYLLFASTHTPEEKLFAQMKTEMENGYLWVIAPRHPRRAEEILQSLKPLKLSIARRSIEDQVTDATDIYLADTLGELKPLMAHATLVVMGGSFNQVGGHNLLEPASLGKAVLTGPSDDNIHHDISYFKSHNAIIQVQNIAELQQKIQQLLDQPQQINKLAQAAQNAVQQQSAILQRYLELIHLAHGSPATAPSNSAD